MRGAPVRGVLFDYGQTLITVERPQAALEQAYQSISAFLTARHGTAVPSGPELLRSVHDRLEAAVAAHARSGAIEEIDLSGQAVAAYLDVGLHITPEQLEEVTRQEQEAWWQGLRVTPGAPAVLRALRERGVRTGLCSNAPYRSARLREQLDHLGLGPLLDSATFSSEVGRRKPSPLIFGAALRALGTEPWATVMVGDSRAADVEGARSMGMRTVRTRQHRDDSAPHGEADAVVDRLEELPPLLVTGA